MRLLRLGHAPALLAFERENRAWFAASVPDRGEDCFARFDERLRALPAGQEAGICFFRVLVGPGGEALGRVGHVDAEGGVAELGYRIAERAAGRGVATRAVREVCALAARAYGLDRAAGLGHPRQRGLTGRTGPHRVRHHRHGTARRAPRSDLPAHPVVPGHQRPDHPVLPRSELPRIRRVKP
ncbi:GNAT family N-acetyltransferase [Streptomyces sp. NPDC054844]